MENNEKPVSRNHLAKLARIYEFQEEELYTIWIADKVYDIVKDEKTAFDALNIVKSELNKRRAK
jgi:hypothetical protein